MDNFTPLFNSVVSGSLSGKYPDLLVWLLILAMADKNGVVKHSTQHMAVVSGLKQEDIDGVLVRFHADERVETARGGLKITNYARYKNKATGSLQRAANPADKSSPESLRFEEFRAVFPKRAGTHRWVDAERFFHAEVGVRKTDPQEIIDGAKRYAAYCASTGRVGSEYVMQAATFLGRNRGWMDPWGAPERSKEKPWEAEKRIEAEDDFEKMDRAATATRRAWASQ